MRTLQRVVKNVEYFLLGFTVGVFLWEWIDAEEKERSGS